MPYAILRLVHRISDRVWLGPALVLVVAGALGWGLMAAFEPADSKLRDPLHYLWYFFVSGTTTGYGDLYPGTTGGRVGGAIVIVAGLTAGLMLFAELTLWMAKGRTMKATGLARLHHRDHLVVVGYHREGLHQIVGQLRADAAFAKIPVVTVFWPDQLSGENPDPGVYDVVRYDETAYERAGLADARSVLVVGRNDDETVRVMLGLHAHLRRREGRLPHLLAGVHQGVRRGEIAEALELIDPDIELVDVDDPAVVAVAIRNPGVSSIYHNLASTLDSDSSLFRLDVPEGAGEWPRFDVAVFLLRQGCTLLAVGESHRPNARFRLAAEPDETVRGGQSLAVVAVDRPRIDWSTLARGAGG